MKTYNMGFSLNRGISIEANSAQEAEQKLEAVLKSEGIDVDSETCDYSLEVFALEESEPDDDSIDPEPH